MATAAAAPAIRWAREYETIYILRPTVDNAAAEKIVERAKDVISRLDGRLTKLDNWGKRKLAYPIQKSNRGIFVYLKYVGFSDLVAELERNLRLLDEVIRFQTVLLTEDIDPASVAIDPDEVQYLHVEEDEEDAEDAELERARSLGMAPRAPRPTPTDDDDGASESETAAEGAPEAAAKTSQATEAPAAEAPAVEAPAADDATDESTEAESDSDKREEG